MKVEIELSELELLRRQLKEKQTKIDELQGRLGGLSARTLNDRAIDYSFKLFENYLTSVFKQLGFDDSVLPHINMPLIHKAGDEWWANDKVTFELGANVTKNFKKAFLNIGVITK